MDLKQLVGITCLLLIVCAGKSYGSKIIKCYSCKGCNDPFLPTAQGVQVVNCSSSCFKAKGSVIGLANVDRGCDALKERHKVSICQKITVTGVETDECYCNGNYCNVAITPRASFGVLLTMGLGIFLILQRLFV